MEVDLGLSTVIQMLINHIVPCGTIKVFLLSTILSCSTMYVDLFMHET